MALELYYSLEAGYNGDVYAFIVQFNYLNVK